MSSSPDARDRGATDAPLTLNPSLAFVARAAAWVLALFALVRVPWIQQHVLLPFAGLQGKVACALVGTPSNSVFVGLSCTGADPMALVLGAVLAFPVAWSRRIRGAALGLGVILVLNTARIGTLSLVVEQRDLFNLLHVYVWPGILIVAAAAYVFAWMGSSLRSQEPSTTTTGGSRSVSSSFSKKRTLEFLGLTSLFVVLFYLMSPWLMSSDAVLEIARWATLTAATVMALVGVPAEVNGNTLQTASGIWAVTQACVATPLLPVYLAAVAVLPITRFRKAAAALAALPLFILLGSARLLVLALPAALVGSHATAVHAFYQVLAAVLLVAWISWGSPNRALTAVKALAAGVACAYSVGFLEHRWLWPAAERLADSLHLGHAWIDQQRVLVLMPAYQLGLFVALWFALRRSTRDRGLYVGAGILLAFQALALIVIGEVAVHATVEVSIAALRALSLAVPLIVIWWTGSRRREERADPVAEPSALSG